MGRTRCIGHNGRNGRNGGGVGVVSYCTRSRRGGLSLVESLVSMLLVAGLIVVSLDTFGATAAAGGGMKRIARAQLLAQGLMSEILEAAYIEPSGLDILFGPELGEVDGTRPRFDDVDDYHNLNDSPPTRRDGTVLPKHTGWRRKVEVKYVQSSNLSSGSLTDQGVKRITVWVCWNAGSCNGTNALVELTSVRTNTPHSEKSIVVEKKPGEVIIELPPPL